MDNQKMRLGLYRKIEIARKQLPAMDEEAFRALLRSEFGVSSRKDMSVNQLSRLVQHFAAVHGVTYTAPAQSRNPRVTPHGRPDFIEITDSTLLSDLQRREKAFEKKRKAEGGAGE